MNPRIDIRESEYSLIYRSHGEALVYNSLSGKVEVYARRPDGVSGWALTIDGEVYEFCREADEHDLGGLGSFGQAVRAYVKGGKRADLFDAYRFADTKRRAILVFIEPRLPDMVAAMDCSLMETHDKMGEVFERSIRD